MCWNEPVSWTTFAIGTALNIFNIFYFQDTTLTLISLVLQWLLLMQFFEALAWRDQNCGQLNNFATNGALIANVTQPLIVFMLFCTFTPANETAKTIALSIAITYTCYILYKLNQRGGYQCLQPSDSCSHLDLYWWKDMSGFIYCLALFSIMLLLIRPIHLAVFTSSYIGFTLVLSILFYSCGVGSMWCWFTSFAPAIIGLYWYYNR